MRDRLGNGCDGRNACRLERLHHDHGRRDATLELARVLSQGLEMVHEVRYGNNRHPGYVLELLVESNGRRLWLLIVRIGRLERRICRRNAVQAGLFLRKVALRISQLLGQGRNLYANQIGHTGQVSATRREWARNQLDPKPCTSVESEGSHKALKRARGRDRRREGGRGRARGHDSTNNPWEQDAARRESK